MKLEWKDEPKMSFLWLYVDGVMNTPVDRFWPRPIREFLMRRATDRALRRSSDSLVDKINQELSGQ